MKLDANEQYIEDTVNEIRNTVIYDIKLGADQKGTLGTLAYNVCVFNGDLTNRIPQRINMYSARQFKEQLKVSPQKKLLLDPTFKKALDHLNDIYGMLRYQDVANVFNDKRKTCPKILSYVQARQYLKIPKQTHVLKELILHTYAK